MSANGPTDVPGGVTVVAMLAMVVGIVELIAGVVLVVASGDVHGYSTTSAIVFGIVTFLVGAIYVWVGRGLLKLDPAAGSSASSSAASAPSTTSSGCSCSASTGSASRR